MLPLGTLLWFQVGSFQQLNSAPADSLPAEDGPGPPLPGSALPLGSADLIPGCGFDSEGLISTGRCQRGYRAWR